MVADNETLVERIRGGYSVSENMQMLYENNLPLIKKIIKPYAAYEPMEDLLQEAFFGLWTTVQRYESSKEVQFMTYSQHWILAAVRKYLVKCGSTVRLPVHVRQKLTRCGRVAEQIRNLYGREPCLAEIASFTGISENALNVVADSLKRFGSVPLKNCPLYSYRNGHRPKEGELTAESDSNEK